MNQRGSSRLPGSCAMRLASGTAVIVVPGMSGFYVAPDDLDPDEYNRQQGVTPQQFAAIKLGLLGGWGTPGADPGNYDRHGEPIRQRILKKDVWEPTLPGSTASDAMENARDELERSQNRLARRLLKAGHPLCYVWGEQSRLLHVESELTVSILGRELTDTVKTLYGLYPYRGRSVYAEEAGCFCTAIPVKPELPTPLMNQWTNEINKNRSAAGKLVFDEHGLTWISGFPLELLPATDSPLLQTLFWRHLDQFRGVYREYLLVFGGDGGGKGEAAQRAAAKLKLVHSSNWTH